MSTRHPLTPSSASRASVEWEELPSLPSFKSGGALVDLADREALYRAMEGR